MSADWSKAPEGAVAYICRLVFGSPFCHWLMARHTHEWVNTDTILAPDFGLPPGVTIRPSAAEAELQAELDSLRDLGQMIKDRIAQMPDDEDCPGLIDGAAVINEITRVCSSHGHRCDDDSLWFQGSEWNAIIQEREDLRAERDQLRDENSALIEKCAQACESEAVEADETGAEEDRAYNIALKHAAAAIRALKSNRATVAESPQSIEPIPGATASLAKLTIRGGGHE